MSDFEDPEYMKKLLGHDVDYSFNDLLHSEDSDVRYLAQKLLVLRDGLDRVVDSKETYVGNALRTEHSEKDALISTVGAFKNIIDEIWTKYDVDNKRHIER